MTEDFHKKVNFTAHKEVKSHFLSLQLQLQGFSLIRRDRFCVFEKWDYFPSTQDEGIGKSFSADSTLVAETTDTSSSNLFTSHSSKHFVRISCYVPTPLPEDCRQSLLRLAGWSANGAVENVGAFEHYKLQCEHWFKPASCSFHHKFWFIFTTTMQKSRKSFTHLSQLERRRGAPPQAQQRNVTWWISLPQNQGKSIYFISEVIIPTSIITTACLNRTALIV